MKSTGKNTEDSFFINDSPLGFGAFASRNIEKGEHIYTFTGMPITYEQSIAMGNDECYSLQTGTKDYIQLDPPGKFINHSCHPNCGINQQLQLIALKPIRSGEELFFDYSTTMLERRWTMTCKCGHPDCRIIIRDFDMLPADLQIEYIRMGMVQKFILDLLKLSIR